MPQTFMACRPGPRLCAWPRGAPREKDRPSLNRLGVCSLTRGTDKKPAMAEWNMSLNTRQVPGRGGGQGCLEGFTEEGAFQTRTERGAVVSQEGEGLACARAAG